MPPPFFHGRGANEYACPLPVRFRRRCAAYESDASRGALPLDPRRLDAEAGNGPRVSAPALLLKVAAPKVGAARRLE